MRESTIQRPRNPWEDDPYKKEYPFEYLKYEVDKKERIATVTLSNAAGSDIAPAWYCYQGINLIKKWERDDDVRVVVIKSAGKDFCTGIDLGERLETALKERAEGKAARVPNRELVFMARDLFLFYAKLMSSAKPTIAQVHGKCTNTGLTLQRVCDVTIASEDAQFAEDMEYATGWRNMMNPGGRSPYETLRYEMAICGRTLSGKQAADMGIINRAVPRQKLDEEVFKEAKKIAAHSVPQLMRFKLSESQDKIRTGVLIPTKGGENIRHEPGEFSFFYVIREKSISEATRQRKELYAPLGGFGIDAEVDRVIEKRLKKI